MATGTPARALRAAVVALLLGAGPFVVAPTVVAAPEGAAEAQGEVVAHAEDAHGEGHGQPWGAIFFNFIVFVGILVFFLRRPIHAFFSERRASIENSLAAAEKARAEAQEALVAAEQRLSEVEADAEKILTAARATAEAERQNILDAAGAEAERVIQQAEVRVADMESAARRRLRAVAADLAVELARERITSEIGPEDRSRIFERNLSALESQGAASS